MTVLSDSEIQDQIKSGKLVLEAEASRAEECSYAFRAGRAFLAGHDDGEIDFASDPRIKIVVDPGKMVWIRTYEKVSLPNDLVGFWWQTNTLSKKGLMLINMSMVEPGYNGCLACLFVNFGNQKIVIEAKMSIAKMVFVRIGGQVASPYTKTQSVDEYDHALQELSVNQPSSFLQIGDIASGIDHERTKAIKDVEDKIAEGKTTLENESKILSGSIASEFSNQKTMMINEFKADAPKAIWKSLGYAALVLLLIGISTAIAGWVYNNAFEDTKKIAREEAIKAVNDRVVIRASTASESSQDIEKQIKTLTDRLVELESAAKSE
ncbi:dCTP deaminase domain-containing protein [Sphingorhabdus sp. SMR4y]|uniref:dCTP deaminase n=1 Tax=Sphingorhabdus sp. SMR4y TaxID=2584094 RepID=UPI000B5C4545|nr:hypothetical protein [Sphingorhabdus sp. SMR4y]ASK88205.1 deoxycytidine triphosphate deaminase [Sphingorhabdus sp. SMR4y]